ncbi:hypothetical protein FQZ97_996840 [compost metagenome]
MRRPRACERVAMCWASGPGSELKTRQPSTSISTSMSVRGSRSTGSALGPANLTTTDRRESTRPRSAAGVSMAARRPRSMMATRWHSWSASSMLWVVMNTVMPCSRFMRTITSRIIRVLATSRPDVGSSRNRICGELTKAMQSISRWRKPLDSSRPFCLARVSRSKICRSSVQRCSRAAFATPCNSAISSTFWRTVRSA